MTESFPLSGTWTRETRGAIWGRISSDIACLHTYIHMHICTHACIMISCRWIHSSQWTVEEKRKQKRKSQNLLSHTHTFSLSLAFSPLSLSLTCGTTTCMGLPPSATPSTSTMSVDMAADANTAVPEAAIFTVPASCA